MRECLGHAEGIECAGSVCRQTVSSSSQNVCYQYRTYGRVSVSAQNIW